VNAPVSNERLSAFIDGELEGTARDGVVDALYQDPALRRTWERFHLVGDAMRGVGPVPGADAIAREVGVALAGESVVRLKPRARPSRLRPLVGAAIAAAIAGIAVLGLHRLDRGDARPPQIAETSPLDTAAAAPGRTTPDHSGVHVVSEIAQSAGTEVSRLQWSGVAPDAEARLNAYLVNHNEYAGHGVHGVLTYVRIVGYQSFVEVGH